MYIAWEFWDNEMKSREINRNSLSNQKQTQDPKSRLQSVPNSMLQGIFVCPRTSLPCPNMDLFLVLANCYWTSLCICCTCAACHRVSCSTCNAVMKGKNFVLSCNVLALEIWHGSVLWIAVCNQLSPLLPWRTKYCQQTLQSHLSPSFPLSFMNGKIPWLQNLILIPNSYTLSRHF